MFDIEKAWQLIVSKLTLWMREFIKLLPNMVLAALVLVIGFFVAKVLRGWAHKYILRSSRHHALNNLFSSFVYILFVGISIFTALSILKLDDAVTSLLAGAGIVGLALAFAFQDVAANFISGIFLIVRRPLKVGDIVKTKDYMGCVEDINLRDTMLRTFQGQMVIIPNKEILQNPIENFSMLGKRRMDLLVGVSYGEDLEKVREITLAAVKNVSVKTADEVTLFFKEFADSSITFELRIWISSPEQPVWLQGRSEAIINIKKAYDDAGITIPFPIRTLDFGIKGGTTLEEMPVNVRQSANGGDSLSPNHVK